MSSSATFDVIMPMGQSLIVVRTRVKTNIIKYVHQEAMYGMFVLTRQHNNDTRVAVSSLSCVPKPFDYLPGI